MPSERNHGFLISYFFSKSFHQCSSANRRGLILALANIGNQHPVWIFCHGFPGPHQWFHCQLHSNLPTETGINYTNLFLLHFVAFFHVALLLSTKADNEKVGVDNEKALELDNRIFFSYFSLISM